MPPRFEFNASDAILQLALRTGQGQNFDKRFAQGQQLVAGVRAQQAQQDALRLEQERLNLAAQAQRRAQGTPSAPARVRVNPFTRSTEEANAEFKAPQPIVPQRGGTPGAGTISGGDTTFTIDDQGNVTGTQGDQELSIQEIRRRGNFVTGRPPEQGNPLRASKQGFIDSLGNLPPDAKQALQFLVDDDSISLKDIAIRANSLKEQRAQQDLSRGQEVRFNRSLLREQVKDIDNQIRDIEDILGTSVEDGGFGINVFGRELPQVFNELNSQPGSGFFGIGGREAQPEAQRLVRQLQELRLQRGQLRAQEQSLIADQVTQAPSSAVGTGVDDVTQQSTDDLLRELLGQ